MPRTPENLVRHELIGLQVEVSGATDAGMAGIEGRVVDETRETLVVDVQGAEKTVPKQGSRLLFELEGASVEVDGNLLVSRPEERILKKFPRKWEYAD